MFELQNFWLRDELYFFVGSSDLMVAHCWMMSTKGRLLISECT